MRFGRVRFLSGGVVCCMIECGSVHSLNETQRAYTFLCNMRLQIWAVGLSMCYACVVLRCFVCGLVMVCVFISRCGFGPRYVVGVRCLVIINYE